MDGFGLTMALLAPKFPSSVMCCLITVPVALNVVGPILLRGAPSLIVCPYKLVFASFALTEVAKFSILGVFRFVSPIFIKIAEELSLSLLVPNLDRSLLELKRKSCKCCFNC